MEPYDNIPDNYYSSIMMDKTIMDIDIRLQELELMIKNLLENYEKN